jgi:hypothetical protein
MSIESIFIVLLYSAKPYLWLIILLLFIPIISYLIKLPSLFNHSQTIVLSVAIGILVALAAPYITYSKLQYVSTLADWGALIAIMLGATLYCWFTLTLLFKKRN